MYKEIQGDLIDLALKGNFDVIAHGCNCFCKQKSGIAKQMSSVFDTDIFDLEINTEGDINKLGQIDYEDKGNNLTVVNCYTQYKYGKNHKNGDENPRDYDAIILCMRKLNHEFKSKHIGLPKIGCGLAGGDWNIVKRIIKHELKDCNVTVVMYNK